MHWWNFLNATQRYGFSQQLMIQSDVNEALVEYDWTKKNNWNLLRFIFDFRFCISIVELLIYQVFHQYQPSIQFSSLMFFIAAFFIFGAVFFYYFYCCLDVWFGSRVNVFTSQSWASRDLEMRLFTVFTVGNIPKTQAGIDSVSRPNQTRLFTWFILPCLYLLMPNDAVLTDAKWPDVRLRVHWQVFS